MAKADVLIEVEAVQAVYGDDCLVLDKYPPHLHLHLKPRTADVLSQQFVEAVLGIRAGLQYPDEPPQISIVDCKGLDEQRQRYLVKIVHDKACELSSYSMLVTLCEGSNEAETNDDKRLLQSESEIIRRQKFEAILKQQQENNGLIETKRSEVLMPGMFILLPITSSATSSNKEVGDQLRQELAANDETIMSGSSYQPSTSGHRNSGMRKHRGRNSTKQVKQWRTKDNSNTGD
ncbi:hypothetical protein RJ639_004707 [Escallonia herrerae]|uniref:RWD domain-containing protein n=1 Tax=Escallonia herrerae TaxID=1293975 RepID=A0AA88W2A8_9ASTE|nr:hypothetical protein RJ639_004707 [Escallonia herrerae]